MKLEILGFAATLALFDVVFPAAAQTYTYTTIDSRSATVFFGRYGINNEGQIVGSYLMDDNRRHGFIYSGGVYATIDVPSGVETSASGINNKGQIVGQYFDSNHIRHGFLYKDGTYTTLEFASPSAINDMGQIVGLNEAGASVLYSGGVFTTLAVPGATDTTAEGINNSGQIVGYYSGSDGTHGFLYSGGAYAKLDASSPGITRAGGINNSGQIVGSYVGESAQQHGFIYSDGVYTHVDDPLGMTFPSDINDRGQIVGRYVGPLGFGDLHIFLATPAP
jgi:probable HAF family extracellular repeat protein